MLDIHSLEFKYANSEKYVLKNIDLKVNSGEYISVVGENGCGKSTLIKLILKLLKPLKGSIRINTEKIGYLPQKKENLNDFPITVFEALESYRKIVKVKDKNCTDNALKSVNLSEFKKARVGELSGGQLQKLYIARALIGNRPC